MSKIKSFGWLTVNVLALGFVSLLTDISSEMVFCLLPFFMTSVLGIEMSLVGLIEGAAEATASVLKVFSGWFSDRLKERKPLAVLGYSLSTMLKPMFAFATSSLQVLFIRILERVGKGIRTSPRDALIADSIQAEVRGKAYGLHRSMDTLGAVIGPLIAFLLFPLFGYKTIFLLSVIPAAVAVALLVTLVKERAPVGNASKTSPLWSEVRSLSREFKTFVIIATIFTLSRFSYAFFLLRATNLGLTAAHAPLLYVLFNVVYAAFAFPAGALADKIGKGKVISLGYVVFSATCVGLILASSPLHAVILFIGYGLSYAVTDAVQRAIVPDLVKPELRGTAFGVLHTSLGLAALPASVIAGALWQYFGPAIPFAFGATLSLISATLFLALLHGKK